MSLALGVTLFMNLKKAMDFVYSKRSSAKKWNAVEGFEKILNSAGLQVWELNKEFVTFMNRNARLFYFDFAGHVRIKNTNDFVDNAPKPKPHLTDGFNHFYTLAIDKEDLPKPNLKIPDNKKPHTHYPDKVNRYEILTTFMVVSLLAKDWKDIAVFDRWLESYSWTHHSYADSYKAMIDAIQNQNINTYWQTFNWKAIQRRELHPNQQTEDQINKYKEIHRQFTRNPYTDNSRLSIWEQLKQGFSNMDVAVEQAGLSWIAIIIILSMGAAIVFAPKDLSLENH